MTVRAHLLLIPLALLAGCGGGAALDTDGDGLTDEEETALGLDIANADSDGDGVNDKAEVDGGWDPLVADSDGDGLVDGDELANGSDPLVVDTDADGYTDRDEVFEGHDPADDKDRIYQGRWPYYFEKTELGGYGDTSGLVEAGKRFGDFKFVDQHGDKVDLYDFFNDDKPVVVDISALWCGPCNGAASWLDGQADAYGWGALWPAGPEVVERGDVYWITILGEDMSGVATRETPQTWYDMYPSKHIPVLADQDYESADYVGLGWWPTVYLLEPNLKVSDATTTGYLETVLTELNSRYPE